MIGGTRESLSTRTILVLQSEIPTNKFALEVTNRITNESVEDEPGRKTVNVRDVIAPGCSTMF